MVSVTLALPLKAYAIYGAGSEKGAIEKRGTSFLGQEPGATTILELG